MIGDGGGLKVGGLEGVEEVEGIGVCVVIKEVLVWCIPR